MGNVLVWAWVLGLAAAVWPAVVLALVACAAAAATRRGWGCLAGGVAVAALPLAFGADAGALLEAAPAWRTSSALDALGVGGWLEAVAPVCVPLGLALAAVTRARQLWAAGGPAGEARAPPAGPKRDRDRRALKLGLFLDGDRDAVRLKRRLGGSGKTMTLLRVCAELAR